MTRSKEKDTQMQAQTTIQIQNAALTCFALQGFGTTKISDIAKHAGVSVGSIYKYFPTKESLFLACLDEALALPPYMLNQLRNQFDSLTALRYFLEGFLAMLTQTDIESKLGKYRFILSIDAFTKQYSFIDKGHAIFQYTPLFSMLESMLNDIYASHTIKESAKRNAQVLTYLFVGLAQSTNQNTPQEMIPSTTDLLALIGIHIKENNI